MGDSCNYQCIFILCNDDVMANTDRGEARVQAVVGTEESKHTHHVVHHTLGERPEINLSVIAEYNLSYVTGSSIICSHNVYAYYVVHTSPSQ